MSESFFVMVILGAAFCIFDVTPILEDNDGVFWCT